MTSDIIEVKQLPIIKERLKELKEDIKMRVNSAVSMPCTENNYKNIKKIRAEFNKEFKIYEDKKKELKSQILEPYKAFEEVYKDCVSDSFNYADKLLKKKIDDVEKEIKNRKRVKIVRFAEELKASFNLEWLDINRLMPKINISTSTTTYISQIAKLINEINSDVQAIGTDAELLAEYENTLNLAQAQLILKKRKEDLKRAEDNIINKNTDECQIQEQEVVKIKKLEPPVIEIAEKLYTTTFTVKGTLDQLKNLKSFIKDNNIELITNGDINNG